MRVAERVKKATVSHEGRLEIHSILTAPRVNHYHLRGAPHIVNYKWLASTY